VELFGHLDEKGAHALDAEFDKHLSAAEPGLGVIFVMMGLSDCAEAARPVLVKLQKRVAKTQRRTAYVDDRARFRGMALWVMHLAQDPNAKAVSSVVNAMKWIQGAADRNDDAGKRMSF
jgi:hypothetical protein